MFSTTSREQTSDASSLLKKEGIQTVEIISKNRSFKPMLNPPELLNMPPRDVEMYRRLQVTTSHLLVNSANLSILHNKWLDKLRPLKHVIDLCNNKNPLNWTIKEVADFVVRLPNCSKLGKIFTAHEIDGLAFLSLRQSDMTQRMGLNLGASIKIFNRILFLREECNAKYIRYA